VIVACEQCSTRFRLDESRIPAGGARVRCSRCKHAFFLVRADTEGDLLDELVSEAATQQYSVPRVTEDLESAAALEPAEPAAASGFHIGEPDAVPGPEEEESDWEFSEEPAAATEADDTEAPETAPSFLEEDSSDSLAALGNPDSWDFVGEEEPNGEEPQAACFEAAPPEAESAPAAEPEAGVAPRARERIAPAAAEVPTQSEVQGSAETVPRRRFPLLPVMGWSATVALVLVALQGIFLPIPTRDPAPPKVLEAGALVSEGLEARFVENAFAGPVFVVSGRLRNPEGAPRAADAALRVVLLGQDGTALPGAEVVLGPALEEPVLREEPPEDLRRRLEAGATHLSREVLGPGESLRFDAVFAEVPVEASRVGVTALPLAPARPASEIERPAGDGDAAGPAGKAGMKSAQESDAEPVTESASPP
jgi:predicted Zn finger-like uncharacterized protein